MKITPLDIKKKSFRMVWRGLDDSEVGAFLDLVAVELEEAVKENISLKEDLRRSTARLEEYTERERILQETLLTAQRITSDIKEQARKEAELLLAEAEQNAQKIAADAHGRVVELIGQINDLKRLRVELAAGLRHAAASHLALVDTLLAEVADGDGRPKGQEPAGAPRTAD